MIRIIIFFLLVGGQILSEDASASMQDVTQKSVKKDDQQRTDQLIQHYRIILQNHNARPSVQTTARLRLVELYLRKAIGHPGIIEESSINEAIQILENMQNNHDSWMPADKVLYELSHAYSLKGDRLKSIQFLREIERYYPQSTHYSEAIYRIADYEFTTENYIASAEHFATLLEIQASEGKIDPRTRYMLAWSYYKAELFDKAIEIFYELLHLVNDARTSDDSSDIYDDSIRGLGLTIENEYSPDQITEYLESRFSDSFFLSDLYQFLSEHANRDERYQDAARILHSYAKNHPDNDDAPKFLIRAASILDKAGFFVQEEMIREALIEGYPITSHFWSTHSGNQYTDVIATIGKWTYEAAKTWHARARQSGNAEDYAKSTHYYRLYLDQFPDGSEAYTSRFALAEVWYETGQFDQAAQQYETVAYKWPEKRFAKQAAYASLIALQKSQSERWIDSAIRFVNRFPDHDETSAIKDQILATLQKREDWERLISVIHIFLADNQVVNSDVRLNWLELLGDAYSSQKDFIRSSEAYLEVMNTMRNKDASKKRLIKKKRAAALYHAAEVLRTQQQLEQASEMFMKSYLSDGSGEIASVALYDAALTAKQAGSDENALAWFRKYEKQYTEQAVMKKVPAVLAYLYQSKGAFSKAASELESTYSLMPELNTRKNYLWQAHELYEREGQLEDSARILKIFLNQYAMSQREKIRAMQRLYEIRKKQNDGHSAHYWLKKLAEFPAKNPVIQSQSVIVNARLLLAEESFHQFSKARLDLPLQKTVPEMRVTLERLVKKFETVLEYPIAEDTTQALYRMGQAYRMMADKIMQSPRPTSLSAEEKEAYEFSLEDLAFQYEEQAITLFRKNYQFLLKQKSWTSSIRESLAELARLLPAEFDKPETYLDYYESM